MDNESQLKYLTEVIEKMRKTLDHLEQNWSLDRHDFAEFSSRLLHLEAELKSLREVVFNISGDTKKGVKAALEPMTQQAKDLQEVMEDKKVVVIKESKVNKKRNWLTFWRK